jgi:hypothetical protein
VDPVFHAASPFNFTHFVSLCGDTLRALVMPKGRLVKRPDFSRFVDLMVFIETAVLIVRLLPMDGGWV